ncbi:hypothetical protein GN956_G24064 [Arapaima gigas]
MNQCAFASQPECLYTCTNPFERLRQLCVRRDVTAPATVCDSSVARVAASQSRHDASGTGSVCVGGCGNSQTETLARHLFQNFNGAKVTTIASLPQAGEQTARICRTDESMS